MGLKKEEGCNRTMFGKGRLIMYCAMSSCYGAARYCMCDAVQYCKHGAALLQVRCSMVLHVCSAVLHHVWCSSVLHVRCSTVLHVWCSTVLHTRCSFMCGAVQYCLIPPDHSKPERPVRLQPSCVPSPPLPSPPTHCMPHHLRLQGLARHHCHIISCV